MPPRRRSAPSSSANPLDLALGLITALFGMAGPAGRRKATLVSGALIALLTVGTFGWYLFQPRERKQEIGRLVGNYSQSHKQIRLTEVIWDIWTLYFKNPFVPTRTPPADGKILLAGEPVRTSFPHPLRTLYNTAYTVGYCDALACRAPAPGWPRW